MKVEIDTDKIANACKKVGEILFSLNTNEREIALLRINEAVEMTRLKIIFDKLDEINNKNKNG